MTGAHLEERALSEPVPTFKTLRYSLVVPETNALH
eukprot:CAMPEP_0170631064 /NCGR_PEP_ID=MMETSP0224-20130122/34397_1 /TAXON_ID=285029 /ORGANISM="Togula jolla, Strain CCCM 725" /LENGTH=34 /DNA_ID= /DNA_START= /DNA_END= /DNA_ORIENTATION=